MPQIALPKPVRIRMSLEKVLQSRVSHHRYSNTSIPLMDISSLLYHSLAEKKVGRRTYPSGGALFPIETYLIANAIGQLPRALFHYVPSTHTLEQLWELPKVTKVFSEFRHAEWAEKAPAIFVLTGVWRRSHDSYGDFGYLLSILEAGHIAQNLLLCATALNLASCPLAGFNDNEVQKLLDIDEESEQAVYTMAIGK